MTYLACVLGVCLNIVLPPAEFDHEFSGNMRLHALAPQEARGGVWSKAVRNYLIDGYTGKPTCDVYFRTDAPLAVQAVLLRVERANCNGWAQAQGDVNDLR